MNNYMSIPTPPSSNEDSPQPVYFVASPNSNSFSAPDTIISEPKYSIMPQFQNVNMKIAADGPYLHFIEQPTDKFRFRYRSEMAGTHGSLTGINSDKSRKQTYPTVELVNFDKKAVIRCTIYQTNAVEIDFMPHAHRLIMKRGREEYDDPHDLSVGPEEGFVATFHSMGIIHTAKKNIVGELVRKKTKLKEEHIARMEGKHRTLTTKETLDIKGLAESESKSINLNIVCLRFDAFIVGGNGIYYPLCPPIYSHGINNLKSALTGELKIVRMDHCSSPAKGGKEIFVLVERVTKKNIKIRFYELDDEDNMVWEDWGKFSDLDVHHQYAIVFKTPKYRDEKITSHVSVYMELVRPSDNARSEPKEFTYTPSNDFKPGTKRPRTNDYSSSSYNSSSMSSSELPVTVNDHFKSEPALSMNSWNMDTGLLTSEELRMAMDNIDSDEFRKLFEGLEKSYPSMSNDIDFPIYAQMDDSREIQHEMGPPQMGDKYILDAQTQSLKNMHLSSGYHGMYRFSIPKYVQSNNTTTLNPRSVIKSEVSTEDNAMAERTYSELRSFVDTKPTRARAIEMLQHYLSEENKTNALHIFVAQNRKDEVTFLLKMIYLYQQNLVNVKNSEFQTPLHIAVSCHNEDFVNYLLKCNANVTLTDSEGRTPLHFAVNLSASPEILESILSAEGFDRCIDATDNDGNTPLVNAIEKRNFVAIKLLCNNGADVNKQHNKNGYTPLRFAIEKQNLDIVKYLLNLPNLKLHLHIDFNDISPIEAARNKECKEILECIQKYMEDRHLEFNLKQEIDDDSDKEIDEEDIDIKPSLIPAECLDEIYKNVTKFTSQCLEEVSAVLDRSCKWEDLADLLDLSHIIRSGIIPDHNISRHLLMFAVEKNNDKILEIRNFLENLDEIEAVEAIDRMAREMN